jgi:hypothetical protein
MPVETQETGSGGFSTLEGAIDPGLAQAPILPEDARAVDEAFDDETALGIVLNDAQDCIKFYNSKGLVPLGIEIADNLYHAYIPPQQWADGKPRSNISVHTVLKVIEKLMPSLYLSLFGSGKKQPFIVEPVGKTTSTAARANAAMLRWAIKGSKLKEEMRITMKTCLQYGFCVGNWGWESKQRKEKIYTKQADGTMKGKWEKEDIEVPFYQALDMKMTLVDPALKRQDVQSGARYVIKQWYTNGYGLADFRNNSQYKNIPTDEELKVILSRKEEPTTDTLATDKRAIWREFQAQLEQEREYADPMLQPLEILEWTSEDRVFTVLQRRLVIRNDDNEFSRLPFQSCAFIDVLGSAWGFGVARLIAGEQRFQHGVLNTGADGLALTLAPIFQMLKGVKPGAQSIPVSPGKIMTVGAELKPLIVPNTLQPTTEALEASEQRANEKVGAEGGTNMPNAALRTAQGVQAFAGDVLQRLQYFLEQFISLVYLPTLEAFIEMMKDHLTPKQVDSILTEEEGKAWEGDIADVYNAKVNVDVIGGANMMAKFAAAQLAPQIIQLVSSIEGQLETQGQYFDYAEFAKEVTDLMGWDVNQLFKPMTDEMKKNVMMKNQALTKAQADAALQQQKHQNDIDSIDAKGETQAGVAVVRQIVKTNADHAEQLLSTIQGAGNAGSNQ